MRAEGASKWIGLLIALSPLIVRGAVGAVQDIKTVVSKRKENVQCLEDKYPEVEALQEKRKEPLLGL